MTFNIGVPYLGIIIRHQCLSVTHQSSHVSSIALHPSVFVQRLCYSPRCLLSSCQQWSSSFPCQYVHQLAPIGQGCLLSLPDSSKGLNCQIHVLPKKFNYNDYQITECKPRLCQDEYYRSSTCEVLLILVKIHVPIVIHLVKKV